MDVAERELDRMIERRADREPDHDELEPTYAESVRRFNTRRRAVNREAWVNYHLDQAGRHRVVLEDLITRHEAEAARLQTSDERKSA